MGFFVALLYFVWYSGIMTLHEARQNEGKKILIKDTHGYFMEGILEVDPSGTAIKVGHSWINITDASMISVLGGNSINESGNDGEQLING